MAHLIRIGSRSSTKRHWIRFDFADTVRLSGVGVVLDYRRDSSYLPDSVRLSVDGEECVSRRVHAQFEGLYVIELERETQCSQLNVEWLNEDAARYMRIRQMFVFANRANVVDRALRDCFVSDKEVLAQSVWRCCDVVREVESEHNAEWMRKHTEDREKVKAEKEADAKDKDSESTTDTAPPTPVTPKKKVRRGSIL